MLEVGVNKLISEYEECLKNTLKDGINYNDEDVLKRINVIAEQLQILISNRDLFFLKEEIAKEQLKAAKAQTDYWFQMKQNLNKI